MTRPSISLRRAIETYHRDTSPNGQRLFWKKIVALFESAFSRWLRFNPEMTQRYEREEARNEWALYITEMMLSYKTKIPSTGVTERAVHALFRRLDADRKKQWRRGMRIDSDTIDAHEPPVASEASDVLLALGRAGLISGTHFYFLLAMLKGYKVREIAEEANINPRSAQNFVRLTLERLPRLLNGESVTLPVLSRVNENKMYHLMRSFFAEPNWL